MARRVAERHGIDADALEGTGPDGRVTKEDVQRAIREGRETTPVDRDKPAGEGVERVPLTGIRRTTAERLAANWSETPQVTEGIEVDFSECLLTRANRKAEWREAYGVEPTINRGLVPGSSERPRTRT